MNLGAFSISLNVKNINESFGFYQKLGFKQIGGDIDRLWVIMKNGESVIGLFQGMLEQNTITFNPGWSQEGINIDPYNDVGDIFNLFKKENIDIKSGIKTKSGPAYLILKDPDGNPIFIDQHR